MAIDMIERTSEGAHAPSRLGLHQFADENKHFRNFTGGQDFFKDEGEDWANLFGSKLRKLHLKENQEAEAKVWASYPTSTCDEIQRLIDALALRAETLVKQIAAQAKDPFYPLRIVVVREYEGKTKSLQLQQDCLNIVAKAKEDAQKQETLTRRRWIQIRSCWKEFQSCSRIFSPSCCANTRRTYSHSREEQHYCHRNQQGSCWTIYCRSQSIKETRTIQR